MPTASRDGGHRGLDFLSSEHGHVLQSARGTTRFWTPAPSMIVTQVEGVLTADHAVTIGEEFLRQSGPDPRHLGFHDWEEMTNYDNPARIHLTEVTQRMRPHIDRIHILLRSQIVAFGVRAANVIVKILEVHTERAPFEQALREAILRRRAHSAPR